MQLPQSRVHCRDEVTQGSVRNSGAWKSSQGKLFLAWLVVGMVPLILQTRSFLKFVMPHKMHKSLVVPPAVEQNATSLTAFCPVTGLQMAHIWWNMESTHYYDVSGGRLCHLVSPQYNCHGNYLIEDVTVDESCSSTSYSVKVYFYHGTIGFYSFYEEISGTYCSQDHTIYGHIDSLGTYDINGSSLAKDAGGAGYRISYWFAAVGIIWIFYRAIVLRRSYIACSRYGRRCDQMGEELDRKTAMVFVHETMRLSAHGATNYHRVLLLYLLVEGIMSDLFLLVATEGVLAWFQYISLGYNLSGVVLLAFEMIENMGWLRESNRLVIKRLLFSYESTLIGELINAIGLSHFLTSLSHSDLKHSGYVARAVSYYVWGLVGHAVIIFPLIGFIMFVRILRAVTYMRWKHGSGWIIFTAPCSVDTTLGMLNKMVTLQGYEYKDGKLYYKKDGLKAFGLLRMEEEDGSEFLVLRKLHWITIPPFELFVIGVVSNHHVEPCPERPCLGVVSFFGRELGGDLAETGQSRPRILHGRSSVSRVQASINILPAP